MIAFDLSELDYIKPNDLRQYLRSTGWSLRDSRKNADCYSRRLPNDEVLTVEVLSDSGLGDYRRRTAELVDVLAMFEKCSARKIVEAILTPGDVFRFISHSEVVDSGLIPIGLSIKLREAVRDVLLSAAHSVIHHEQKYFPKLSNKRAREFLDTCREGQTERGSYAALFVVPVSPQLSNTFHSDPFERIVTTTLMRALVHAASVAQSGAYENLLSGVEHGLNANLLDALSRLEPNGRDSYLEIAVAWSSARTLPEIPQTRVRFNQPAFRYLGEASRTLKAVEPKEQTKVVGRVRELKKAKQIQQWGHIVVDWNGQLVGIDLDNKQYQDAIMAHKTECEVVVQGTLQREPRLNLTNVTKFEILDKQRSLFSGA